MEDQEPMCLFGMKLLNLMLEKNEALLPLVKTHNLHLIFYSIFNPESKKLTKNTLEIIQKLVGSKETTLDEINKQNLLEKSTLVALYYKKMSQDLL